MNKEKIQEDIKNLINQELSKQTIEKIQMFVQLFKYYNAHTNLISKNDEQYIYEKHIYDSLALSLFINKYELKENIKILDVGTGGGFPSIPLSIIYPDTEIFAIDSIAKKIGFIELVKKELRLENLTPICKRVEDLSKDYRESFDIVTSRAVASLNTLLEYTIPFAKTNAYFIAYKSKNVDNEIVEAQNALTTLNSEIIDKISYKLPLDETFTREIIVIKKFKNTNILYPRKLGLAKKKPL